MPIAIYPGSFDPITNGHLDIAARAAKIFDRVIIGIYEIPAKNLLFTTEERVALVRQSIDVLKLSNVDATSFTGLTVAFARKTGAAVEVRGLRMSADFEREFEMAVMNKNLDAGLELFCLMASLKYQFLSSSLLKEVACLGGNIDDLVPPHVAVALKQKFHQGKLQPRYPDKETPV